MDKSTCVVEGCDKPRKRSYRMCSMHVARKYRTGTTDLLVRTPPSLESRILPKVIKSEGCWTWTGWIDSRGYAKLRVRPGSVAIHRWMFERHVAPLVDGMVIDHICHNRGCVNPDHLRQVTPKENTENFATQLRSHNTSGFRGVSFHAPSGLWMARVKSSDVVKATYHRTKDEAAESARNMRLNMHTMNDLDRIGSERMSMVRGV